MFRSSCALVITLAATPAVAQNMDRLVFALEVSGHVPVAPDKIDTQTESVSLNNLGPFVHEAALAYGIGISDLGSELVLRTGYGFARGSFPAGSVIDRQDAGPYTLDAVPITIGWRLIFLPYRVRLLLGVDLGGRVMKMTYELVDEDPLQTEWEWRWGLRGLAGIQIEATDWLGIRLYGEGGYSQSQPVLHSPTVNPSYYGFGLAIATRFDRPKPGELTEDPVIDGEGGDEEALLTDYGAAGDTRIDRASALIREADQAKRKRDFIEAEQLYREGVGLLPRDPTTRKNLEVPVRVDWAKVLVEVGRRDDARLVLQEALRITPDDPAAKALLDELGGPMEGGPVRMFDPKNM